MLPFRRILCPTDFSEPACTAIKHAVEMAQHFASELIIHHVVGAIPAIESPTGVTNFDLPAYQRELTSAAETSLKSKLARHVPESVHARTLVTHGDAAHEIVRVAEEEDVDLIVLSTHGATGWRHLIFGSVAERVVKLAKCNVLTVYSRPPE